MVTRTVTIDDTDYVLKPLTRRQSRELTHIAPEDNKLLIEALELSLGKEISDELDDKPLYVSKQLFVDLMDLSTGGKAIKNS